MKWVLEIYLTEISHVKQYLNIFKIHFVRSVNKFEFIVNKNLNFKKSDFLNRQYILKPCYIF